MVIEAETVLQPSLHTISEYVDLVIGEVECRDNGAAVQKLRNEYDADPEGEHIGEIADEALALLVDAGYAYAEQDDTLLIWPKGVEIPEEWQE